MALTSSEQRIFDRLQMRYLTTRQNNSNRRSAVRSPVLDPPKEEKKEDSGLAQMQKLTDALVKASQVKPEAPVVNVTVEAPEAVPVKMETVPVSSPKKWVFKHKYDVYNKLIETTATAE